MQSASPGLTNLINSKRREEPALLRVIFGIVDVEVKKTSTISATFEERFSDVTKIIETTDLKNDYQTLERNSFILGMGGETLPDSEIDYKVTGYTSSILSDENGIFPVYPNNPRINISSTEIHSILGLTFKFDTFRNNWADFNIRIYYNETLLYNFEVQPIGAEYVIDTEIKNWNRMEIEFTKTSVPRRRLRLTNISFGIYRVDDTFNGANHHSEYSPISDKTPQDIFSWELFNIDKEFKPGQETGIQKYIMAQQPVIFDWGYPVNGITEWVRGGEQFTTGKVVFSLKTVKLESTALIAYLTDIFYKGKYSETGYSLYSIAEEVLKDADIPLATDGTVRWELWDGLKNIYTITPLPKIQGKDLLQMIANCAGCVFIPNRYGKIKIGPLSNIQHDFTIDYDSQTSFPTVLENPPLYSLQTKIYNYIKQSQSIIYEIEMTISGATLIKAEYDMATNITASITGGTITSSVFYAAYAEINITGNGTIKLTLNGNKLLQIESIHEKVYGLTGEILTFENQLCTNTMTAELISALVGDFYVKRSIYTANYNGNILLDPLDRIFTENDFEENISGLVISNSIDYNGAWRGNFKWSR